jgi:hypothetical protein
MPTQLERDVERLIRERLGKETYDALLGELRSLEKEGLGPDEIVERLVEMPRFRRVGRTIVKFRMDFTPPRK